MTIFKNDKKVFHKIMIAIEWMKCCMYVSLFRQLWDVVVYKVFEDQWNGKSSLSKNGMMASVFHRMSLNVVTSFLS